MGVTSVVRGKKSKTPDVILKDPKNQEILGVQNLKARATLEEIGQAVGLSPSRVSRRLKDIREALRSTDEVAISNDQIRALVPLAVAVYAAALGDGDKDIARDILRTHDVISDKRKYEFDFRDPKQVKEFLNKVPTEVLNDIASDDDS